MLLETLPEWPIEAAGSSSSALVPATFSVALNGMEYMLDLKSGEFRHVSIPLLRQQADDSTSPAEASLNPDDLWRRAQDSWHLGAGQTFRDREEASPFRFRSSKGIDVWTRYQMSLLPATDQKDTSSDTNLMLVPAGARLYKVEGATLSFTADVTVDSPTWTAVTYAGGAILGACSDGFHVYVTDGANTYVTNTGVSTSAVFSTVDAGGLAYVKSRIMAFGTGATKHSIYNLTTAAPNPAALFSHDNTDFTWVGFAEGRAALYAAGYSGDKSLIYRISIKPDASGLDQPILAGELPDGEIIRSIGGYLGFVFLGTDEGVRFCRPDAQGTLSIGPLIETSSAVRCFEGQGRFMWFGWSNYDATSTGLGRMDLAHVTEPDVPAYASDLMVTAQGNVLSVATFQGIRVFAISASGVWAEDVNKVASGTMDSGPIGFGLPDQKTALFVDVRTTALAGSYSVGVSADGDSFSPVGTESDAGSLGKEFTVSQVQGERFEIRFTLTRAAVTTTGPTLTRWTLKSLPQAEGREFIFWPILLAETLEVKGKKYQRDPAFDLTTLKGLRRTRELVQAQEGALGYSVMVDDYSWAPTHLTRDGTAWNGTVTVKLKVIQ